MRSDSGRSLGLKEKFAAPGGVLMFILLWHVFTSEAILGTSFGVNFSPLKSVRALSAILFTGELVPHIGASLKRIGIGLGAAAFFGIPLGLLTGYVSSVDRITYGTFQFLRMISPLAWMPLAIAIFGIGDKPVYFLVAIAAVWPFIINTSFGVKSVEEIWLRVAKIHRIRGFAFLKRVLIPATLPDILVGLRLALGISWLVLVPAEMLGVSEGLGYYILDTRDRFAYGELIAVILVIGALGYLSDYLIRAIQKKVSWTGQEGSE